MKCMCNCRNFKNSHWNVCSVLVTLWAWLTWLVQWLMGSPFIILCHKHIYYQISLTTVKGTISILVYSFVKQKHYNCRGLIWQDYKLRGIDLSMKSVTTLFAADFTHHCGKYVHFIFSRRCVHRWCRFVEQIQTRFQILPKMLCYNQ